MAASSVHLLVLQLALLGQPAKEQAKAAADKPAVEIPRTTAERTDYKETARHRDVVAFCEALVKLSPLVKFSEMGKTVEGRSLPLLVLSDPPVATAAEAKRSGKLVVLAVGNIHAGEVCGKEALLMLARDLVHPKPDPLLKKLVLVIAPNFNADGNERIDVKNRPHQAGPEAGKGVRTNAQGLDLNRDFIKLETPEVRALVRLMNQWDPAVIFDTHTTNGSRHRYTITYDGPRHAAADPKLVAFSRDELLPLLGAKLEKRSGYASFVYGNFSKDRKNWETYETTPRYGIQYIGLRNRIAVLSEAYAYAPFKDRVLATRDFVRGGLEATVEKQDAIGKLISSAPRKGDTVAIRQRLVPHGKPVTVLGFEETEKEGKRVATDKPKEYSVQEINSAEAALVVKRPKAYLIPPSLPAVTEVLKRHGLPVEVVREDVTVDVEAYRVDKVNRTEREYQNHKEVTIEASAKTGSRMIPAGTHYIAADGPLGTLAVILLEPRSEDGLATWNYFDAELDVGKEFPVLRLPGDEPITRRALPALAEDRKRDQPVKFETFFGRGEKPNFTGPVVTVGAWLEDGEHYLQVKDGKLCVVEAATGKSRAFHDPDAMARGLETLSAFDAAAAKAAATATGFHMNKQRTAALIEHENDLYYCTFDGSKAVRLTSTPDDEELAEFSPDGKFVAFVRKNNLYVVDVATGTELVLTTDGGGLVTNGKADWVYFEEIFNRDWQAYWWCPDSRSIALMRFDDAPLKHFAVVNHLPQHQSVEDKTYPKAGDPSPLVQIGTVSVAGGPVHWLDFGRYTPGAFLVSRVGWKADSSVVYAYVQDRAQTWLDVITAGKAGSETKRLFRDTTKAWIENVGAIHWLKDGSFLYLSERSGWQHLYRYGNDGKVQKAVTSGEWEVQNVHRVDEEAGVVYVTGSKDSHIADNLYAVPLTGGEPKRLTTATGAHRVTMAEKGPFVIDSGSDPTTPTQVRLLRTDGSQVRMIDTNPVFALEEYRFGKTQFVKVPMPDGFQLEGTLLLPPDYDAKKKYPAWVMTYAGPHAPTVTGGFTPQRLRDQFFADMGIVIFRVDPRSASGKGACSAWTAYRQLGVPELKDLEAAVAWLTKTYAIDPARVGLQGHSYGGFMTAFALTHSKVFSAGVSGAPVTDWRNYDSIYTERYMNTPQENPDGYEATSVVKAADKLHGKLLLLHGLMDDNVHVQNSLQFMNALQRANKPFEVMFYPTARHGIFGDHYDRLVVEFIRRAMLGPNVVPLAVSEGPREPAPGGRAGGRRRALPAGHP